MNILFDLDGTLIDRAPDIQSVASIILGKLGKDELSLEQARSFVGEGSASFVRRMMVVRFIVETPENFARIHNDFVALYEFALEKTVFYPGVHDVMARLQSAGH